MPSSENNIEKNIVWVPLKIQEIGSPFQEIGRFGGFPGVSRRMWET